MDAIRTEAQLDILTRAQLDEALRELDVYRVANPAFDVFTSDLPESLSALAVRVIKDFRADKRLVCKST